ncbi:MAG: hypothetical protein AAF533_04080 [Acidobacteriota bacterium]
MKASVVAITVALACTLLSFPVQAEVDLGQELLAIEDDLRAWDVIAASWRTSRLRRDHPERSESWLSSARVAFHEADYPLATRYAEQAVETATVDEDLQQASRFVAYLTERRELWDSFEEHRIDDFILRVTEKDRILVEPALTTLLAAGRAMERELGYCPERPVVVEIYPDRRSFIAASSLTREEVETSGTIAICHYNRIMVVSPGVLSRGYGWLDTLCHEYVHHCVYHIGRDAVPVWLHEGLAKVLESYWRDEPRPALDPRLASTLAEGVERDIWVSFEQMHPSMAKLPSGALVSLAFAEVAVAIDGLRHEPPGGGGPGSLSLRDLIDAVLIHDGDIDRAFEVTTGLRLPAFEEWTRERAGRLDLHRIPGLTTLDEEGSGREFVDEGDGVRSPEEETRSIEDRKARDFTVLGDRLKGRGHHEAAVIEYDKALDRLGQSEPLVQNRKVLAMIQEGQLEEARGVLEETLTHHPESAVTLDNLGEIASRLASAEEAAGRPEAARAHRHVACRHLLMSREVNPFNPETHLRLAALHRALGRDGEAEAWRDRLRLLLETTQER